VTAAEEQEHDEDDVLVLSADGKGIAMRSEALRAATAKAAQRASPKLKTRLSRGEKPNRKRIAEVGAVYDLAPAPRHPLTIARAVCAAACSRGYCSGWCLISATQRITPPAADGVVSSSATRWIGLPPK
jgi:hypothetical protein